MGEIEKHGTGMKRMRKLLIVESLTDLEKRYTGLLMEGWDIDPDFKDPDTIPTVLQKLYGDNGGLQPKAKITLGMFKDVPVELTTEEKLEQALADLKQANAVIRELRVQVAQSNLRQSA